MEKEEWFKSWFDTQYYHTLYKNRNDDEAKLFVTKLVNFLTLNPTSKVLDLACGKGRHSVTLNELGMNVLGVDLSENSIKFAKQFENNFLKFEEHDMREVIPNHLFQVIFNLFTSFGYFDEFSDNEKVIRSIHSMLIPNGTLVLDFMNSEKTISNLISDEVKIEDGIEFNITRNYDGNHIYKHIKFSDNSKDFHFTERVQALKLNDFQNLLNSNNFQIIHTFGDFNLNPFDAEKSDRLILIATKI
jgi:2-polyprenyl-3-methyl-5-hydroxy-6-metoxy-1,4-benzoquinol methylase